MNRRSLLMKIVASILCIVIIVGTNLSHASASTNDSDIVTKVNRLMANGENIWESLTDEEVIELSQAFPSPEINQFTTLSEEQMDEVKQIDALANEYYNYYKTYGFTEDLDVIPMTYAALDNSQVIELYGYSYTIAQIAQQLASLGLLILYSAAFPFLCLIATISAFGILVYEVATLYSNRADEATAKTLLWYSKHEEEIFNSKIRTIDYVMERTRGEQYWVCMLANYNNLGGILIGNAIKESVAADIIKANTTHTGVFCVSINRAQYIVTKAGYYGYTSPEIHLYDSGGNPTPLNQWHIHPKLASGEKMDTHVWYAGPNMGW